VGLAHAAVHDDLEAGLGGDPVRLLGGDALLEPQDLGARLDRVAGHARGLLGWPEHLDDVDGFLDVGQPLPDFLAKDLAALRVDREDAEGFRGSLDAPTTAIVLVSS
jgi:uncharacterized protein YbjT (DUF2867 family)